MLRARSAVQEKKNQKLMTIGMLGESGRRPGTVSFGFLSMAPHRSFLVRKESFRVYDLVRQELEYVYRGAVSRKSIRCMN